MRAPGQRERKTIVLGALRVVDAARLPPGRGARVAHLEPRRAREIGRLHVRRRGVAQPRDPPPYAAVSAVVPARTERILVHVPVGSYLVLY